MKQHGIRTVYAVHHSHTDIGYTDLQEHVIELQVDYIRTALRMMQDEANRDFRWNCETLYCVEEFFKSATEEERKQFLELAADGRLGLSANYLNFTDLLDCGIYSRRLGQWHKRFAEAGVTLNTAMCADINGISMGQRDAMLDNGVEFLYTNIHCHHGMYPLYQNQNAYFWENAEGKRLLVWNGEHYNLGNVLGLRPNHTPNFMTMDRLGTGPRPADDVEALAQNLDNYLTECEENGYPYDFILASVSGVFSDNAPPEPLILQTIQGYNEKYGDTVQVKMVSLQELYAAIAPKLQDAPVLRGDLNDWWANGVGSTPYAVKHYLGARRSYDLARRLDPELDTKAPELVRQAEDNLLLYAEHTWGHSASITNPYVSMVLDLDSRKNGYASQAHEAAARLLGRIAREQGDILRYYATSGTIRVQNPTGQAGVMPVEFYVETLPAGLPEAVIRTEDGRQLPCQVSPHPRGRLISFTDTFAPHEVKQYTYDKAPAVEQKLNTRRCYVGAERIRDIVNDFDPFTYRLPYSFENRWFRLEYKVGQGLCSLFDKRAGRELMPKNGLPFFTPVYECTPVRPGQTDVYEERRLLGRNVRGKHAKQYPAVLEEVICEEHGPVFTILRLRGSMTGSIHCDVVLKLYEDMPRIDLSLELGKTLSTDVESVYLPLTLDVPGSQLWLRKGGREAMRPGVDQLPGTNMEYSMSDDGLAFVGEDGGVLLAAFDTPLYYFGELAHHPIRLCERLPEDNRRPVYSWLMNNTWETNFKLDLSGFTEYRYTLWLTDETDPERALDALHEQMFAPIVRIVG
ncbi:hypothetical protein [Allofournierella sp. CML151]|uniref:glycoside hydrolase family 38 N-terminal domain-containing protein n=1 Tax=Allofournierella sp. CML151 TaxID=2998082 RepID=UPI0022EA6AF0|nr:hypothetical protein [Fournierella sp. CML151]